MHNKSFWNLELLTEENPLNLNDLSERIFLVFVREMILAHIIAI